MKRRTKPMRKRSRKASIVAIIVVLILALAVLLARTRPWMHRLALQSSVQRTSVAAKNPSTAQLPYPLPVPLR
jgi:flagellar basal body-associated protein FliL